MREEEEEEEEEEEADTLGQNEEIKRSMNEATNLIRRYENLVDDDCEMRAKLKFSDLDRHARSVLILMIVLQFVLMRSCVQHLCDLLA